MISAAAVRKPFAASSLVRRHGRGEGLLGQNEVGERNACTGQQTLRDENQVGKRVEVAAPRRRFLHLNITDFNRYNIQHLAACGAQVCYP